MNTSNPFFQLLLKATKLVGTALLWTLENVLKMIADECDRRTSKEYLEANEAQIEAERIEQEKRLRECTENYYMMTQHPDIYLDN